MTIPNLSEIPTLEEGINLALSSLREYVRELLPTHKLILANQITSLPTEPYVSFKQGLLSGDNSTDRGNDPIHRETLADESEVYLYQYLLQVNIKAYKENAFAAASKIRQGFNNSYLHYKYFGNTSLGYHSCTPPVDDPTPIDNQKWEAGASLTVTIGFIAKEIVTETFGNIQTVSGTATTKDTETGITKTWNTPAL